MGEPSAGLENNKWNIYEKIDVAKKTCQNIYEIKYKLKSVYVCGFVGVDACVRTECVLVCVCVFVIFGPKNERKNIVVLTSMIVV